ncbi:hypothetical protein JNUCC31_22965 [Paenibacillus sp. JNUCC31]|uniref:hypothetical protein n=1 Tax=Paenibacillus sp. JNUCC-31 TaxID=2777983 RepID=UPI00177D07A4|nr:hypothetical protein [Paenibacillus sp. JNUCC-31]QOS77608.1 hypothetical protein JNUCC31_22965 [Paenibacillus sp. JNUCC-31]
MKMYLSELEESILSKDQIHKILFGDSSDDGEHCDCVFVPSSNTSNEYRTPAAIELFSIKGVRLKFYFQVETMESLLNLNL